MYALEKDLTRRLRVIAAKRDNLIATLAQPRTQNRLVKSVFIAFLCTRQNAQRPADRNARCASERERVRFFSSTKNSIMSQYRRYE